MSEHSLEKPSFVTAGVLFGFWGGGLAVTQALPPLFWAGIIICFGSAIFTIWRYYEPVLASIGSRTDTLPRWEGGAVSVLVLVEIVGSLYLAIPEFTSESHRLLAYFQPVHKANPHTAHATIIGPVKRHLQNAPSKTISSFPALTTIVASTVPLPKPRPRAQHAFPKPVSHHKSARTDEVVDPDMIFQLNAHREGFLEELRELWVNSHDNVPADIGQGEAWPPIEWLNKMLAAYDHDWRIKSIGGSIDGVSLDFVAEPQPFPMPLENAGKAYNHGIEVPTVTDWQRAMFRRKLKPPSSPTEVTFYLPKDLDPDEESFQKQITSLFPQDAGWTVNIITGPDVDKLAAQHQGLVLFVSDPERILSLEQNVLDAFTAAKFHPIAEKISNPKDNLGILMGRDRFRELMKSLQNGEL